MLFFVVFFCALIFVFFISSGIFKKKEEKKGVKPSEPAVLNYEVVEKTEEVSLHKRAVTIVMRDGSYKNYEIKGTVTNGFMDYFSLVTGKPRDYYDYAYETLVYVSCDKPYQSGPYIPTLNDNSEVFTYEHNKTTYTIYKKDILELIVSDLIDNGDKETVTYKKLKKIGE